MFSTAEIVHDEYTHCHSSGHSVAHLNPTGRTATPSFAITTIQRVIVTCSKIFMRLFRWFEVTHWKAGHPVCPGWGPRPKVHMSRPSQTKHVYVQTTPDGTYLRPDIRAFIVSSKDSYPDFCAFKIGVFPIIAPHKITAPHYGIVTMMGGGAIGYMPTKLGGGAIMGNTPK